MAATLRAARLNLGAGTFLGFQVALNDTFRTGSVTVDPSNYQMAMSSQTWNALVTEDRVGGVTSHMDQLATACDEAVSVMQIKMVDLSKGPKKVVDRRTVTRYSDDRVDYVCRGISDLVSQMSTLLSQPLHLRAEGTVNGTAKRYVELAQEMKKLREAMLAAEGHFEIAQRQVIMLMGEE